VSGPSCCLHTPDVLEPWHSQTQIGGDSVDEHEREGDDQNMHKEASMSGSAGEGTAGRLSGPQLKKAQSSFAHGTRRRV
jgi:hypothetical protein